MDDPCGWLANGLPVMVTSVLPCDRTDESGAVVGKHHWLMVEGVVWVSAEARERLRESLPPATAAAEPPPKP